MLVKFSGWVSVASGKGTTVRVRAYTAGGLGLTFRTPSLLLKSVALRGKRVPYTPKYEVGNVLS